MEQKINQYNEEGVPHGVHISYYENGIVESIENFHEGALISLQTFAPNGLLIYSECYGMEGTTVMWWQQEGDLQDARWNEYHTNSTT